MTQRLTEKAIERLTIPKREPRIKWDAVVSGFGIKVTPSGKRVFVLQARLRDGEGQPNSYLSKMSLGNFPALGLAEARAKAEVWRGLVAKGEDPRQVEERAIQAAVRAEQRKQAHIFESVAEVYVEQHLVKLRRGKDDAREIRKHLIPKLGHLPIAEISRFDIVETIKPIAKRAPYVAHICLNHVKRIYSWAIEQGCYGLDQSPADRIKPRKLIGVKKPRVRTLTDNEIRAFWKASIRLGYPFAGLYQLIALTGCRMGEASGARWREFDMDEKVWRIPEARFKSGQQHVLPISEALVAVLEALPRWTKGDYLFSLTSGKAPVGGFGKPKRRLELRMAAELGSPPEPFVVHDIRRTVRSRLSELRVPDVVAEMVLGHGKKGLARVYDQYGYRDEMREALEAWALRLRSIVEPQTSTNVVRLAAR
jgi:integrase